ncbi:MULTISPECIES: hypothetical protein [Bacteria]|uniref:hypothetical protein n=1 Tax=Bacteria TaxID=2 RepID=UPI00363BB31B
MEAQIEYTKEEVLKISFSTLVIKVNSIKEKYGDFKAFASKLGLSGVTNGKLFLIYEMMEPPYYLIEKVEKHLLPLSFKPEKDFVFIYEQMTIGLKGEPSPLLNKEHPATHEIPWLSSLIHTEGNFVWLEEKNFL